MTNARCNEIFKAKYPTGCIYKDKHVMCVVFKRGGKVYDYQCNSYPLLLRRLGFNVVSKEEFNRIYEHLDKLTEEYKDLPTERKTFFGGTVNPQKQAADEINEILKDLEQIEIIG